MQFIDLFEELELLFLLLFRLRPTINPIKPLTIANEAVKAVETGVNQSESQSLSCSDQLFTVIGRYKVRIVYAEGFRKLEVELLIVDLIGKRYISYYRHCIPLPTLTSEYVFSTSGLANRCCIFGKRAFMYGCLKWLSIASLSLHNSSNSISSGLSNEK